MLFPNLRECLSDYIMGKTLHKTNYSHSKFQLIGLINLKYTHQLDCQVWILVSSCDTCSNPPSSMKMFPFRFPLTTIQEVQCEIFSHPTTKYLRQRWVNNQFPLPNWSFSSMMRRL